MPRDESQSEIENKKKFLDDLEAISRKYGIVIDGTEFVNVRKICEEFTGYSIDKHDCLETSPYVIYSTCIKSYGLEALGEDNRAVTLGEIYAYAEERRKAAEERDTDPET